MNWSLRALMMVVIAILTNAYAGAQWMQMNGPEGGTLLTALHDGNYLYVAGRGGIYRSSDNGVQWTEANAGIYSVEANYVFSLCESGGTLLAGTDYVGMYRSTNNGDYWYDVSTGLPEDTRISAILAYDAKFYCSCGGGIYLSTDDGFTWEESSTGMPSETGIDVLVEEDDVLYAASYNRGIYKSTDAGASWSSVGASILSSVWALAVTGTTIYAAGTLTEGVYVSTDSGQTWSLMDNGLSDEYIPVLYADSSVVYAGCDNGDIFYATAPGEEWKIAGTGFRSGNSVHGLAVQDGALYAATNGGMYVRDANASAFEMHNTGMFNSLVLSFTSIGDTIFGSSNIRVG